MDEREEVVNEALMRQDINVVRVPANQFVDAAPAVRYEGDTMIVSVMEEVKAERWETGEAGN